ncbi:hypothetical protein JNB11_07425 [Kocuria palustris]|nr:hypothetical protein [Kocuria palustris]
MNHSDIEGDDSFDKSPHVETDSGVEATLRPLALDDAAMTAKLLKPIPDYPVLGESVNRWSIANWNHLNQDKLHGPRFTCAGIEWNVLLFPRGTQNSGVVLIYLEPVPPADLDDDWYVCAQFALALANPRHPEVYLANPLHHRFTKSETDWGFLLLIDLRALTTPQPRYGLETIPLLDTEGTNGIDIIAYVRVFDDTATGVLWHNLMDYDSKQATGYIGLNNQGATCYLNSLLQLYFTTLIFRKLVYQIPTDGQGGVPRALQRMFYMMTTLPLPISTMELTKLFGWDSLDAFMQHDIQELNRILMDKLETAMKGSLIEGELNLIFVGKMKLYIKCINVPYELLRIEDFWDIQLNVEGLPNLESLFKNYVEIEMLEGENKYQANEEYGYQDAKKGVVFEQFPPVLHLQLKRFKYDFVVDDLVKIDDFYEFPDTIDLAPYIDEELPNKNENWTYKLHGVLVHQGLILNGHYYAMIKPNADGGWLKFDDDKVTKATTHQVFDENFGAPEPTPQQMARMTRAELQEYYIKRVTLAYMLVYYREQDLPTILPAASEVTIPEEIPAQIDAELKAREQAEQLRQEEMYYMPVRYITLNQMAAHTGFDLALDETNPKLYDQRLAGTAADPITVKTRKDAELSQCVKTVAADLHNPDNQFRLVPMMHRCNHTNRADRPFEDGMLLWLVAKVYNHVYIKKYDHMVVFVEEAAKELHNVAETAPEAWQSPEKFSWEQPLKLIESASDADAELVDIQENGTHKLIFIKYFDPISQEVRGITHATVLRDDTIQLLIPEVNAILGFDPSTELVAYEELSPLKIEPLDVEASFSKLDLDNGDIVTFEPANASTIATGPYKLARDYYTFMFTRMHIMVSPWNGDEVSDVEPFDLWILTLDTYAQVAAQVAAQLEAQGEKVDPKYLRLYVRLPLAQGLQVYTLRSLHVLSQVFSRQMPVNLTLAFEYEVLPVPLVDYENLRRLEVVWVLNFLHSQPLEVLALRLATVGEIVNEKIIPQLNNGEPVDISNLLVWVGNDNRFSEFLKPLSSLELIQEGADTIYMGIFPVEVYCLAANDMYKRFAPTDSELVKPTEALGDGEVDAVNAELEVAEKHINQVNILPLYHFQKSLNYRHGIPFIFPIYPDETFADIKARLQLRLGMGQQAFSKVKVALTEGTRGLYLEDDDAVVYDQLKKIAETHDALIALDHPDRLTRKPNVFDRGITIK